MLKIYTEKAPAAIGPYSQGYAVNNFIFTSGQIPVNPETNQIPDDISAQAENSCKNVGAILDAAGSCFEKVIKTTCYLADMNDFAAFNKASVLVTALCGADLSLTLQNVDVLSVIPFILLILYCFISLSANGLHP